MQVTSTFEVVMLPITTPAGESSKLGNVIYMHSEPRTILLEELQL